MAFKKKILIVSESIDVEDSSGTKGRVALIRNLNKSGFDLRVYHYTRKEIQLEGIPCVSIRENRRGFLFLLSRFERHLRHKLNLDIHASFENIFGFSFTLFNDRNSIVKALKKTQDFKPDLVLTLSKGGSFRPHHALLKIPAWHARWVAYIHDPYPMHSYPRPYDWVEPGHQKKRKFFLQVAEKAKYAAYPSRLLSEWMESYFPALRGKSIIIPHQISGEEIDSQRLPDFFEKGRFTIVHAGTLLSARNPLPLITAFRRFLDVHPEAKENSQLLFVGPESSYSKQLSDLKNRVPQLFISEGYLGFEKIKIVQQEASVNVILEAKGPLSPFLPGKFPHCIQADKPILLLGPYYSECRRLLGEDYRFWAEIDDVPKIQILITRLYEQWLIGADTLKLERNDLKDYMSVVHLKRIVEGLFSVS